MSTGPERPTFFEGQILAAADLDLSVDAARAAQARHSRYLHTPGVATGLTLRTDARQTPAGKDYVAVTVTRGVAIDVTGREVVVPEDLPLSEAAFIRRSLTAGQPPDAWYPVFLVGRDEAAPLPLVTGGPCATGGETRRVEGHEVEFGGPGEADDQDQHTTPDAVTGGPGDPGSPVVLGFVQWDNGIRQFTAAADRTPRARRRHAGVRADEVRARGDSLVLRTGQDPSSPAGAGVVIDETDGGELRFGPANAGGEINWVFRVTSAGDVKARGSIIGTPGNVHVQSGTATDGLTLPLPPGITDEDVDTGKVALHVHLSPRLAGSAVAANEVAVPLECRLEPGTRRVLCQFRRFTVGGGGVTDELGLCDYLIIASGAPAANSGGTP